jgi:hypothetical protein
MAKKRLRIRRGTAAQWADANPVLRLGEQGYETDSGQLISGLLWMNFKLGDGETAWNDLPYIGVGAPGSGTVSWSDIEGKPTEFAPSAHTHPWEQVTGKPTTFAPAAHTHPWSEVTDKPTTFTPSAHGHVISEVAGLSAALDDKANISDLQNKADLVNGVIPTSQIPAAAITEFLGAVNSESAMLALVGQKGDWCIRTDQNRTYFIVGDNGSVLGNWRFIETPASPVTSVNNQVGVVVLGKGDIGLPNVDNTSDMQKPVSTAQAAALQQKSNVVHGHAISDVAGLPAALDEKANATHTHTTDQIEGFSKDVQETVLDRYDDDGATATPINVQDNIILALAKLQLQILERAVAGHTHAINDVSGLSSVLQSLTDALNGKAQTNHVHIISQITGLQEALDGKAASSHTHSISQISGLQSSLDALTADRIYSVALAGTSPTTTANTAQNIPSFLTSELPANSVWEFDIAINIACNGTGGVRIGYVAPSGATGVLWLFGTSTSGTAFTVASTGSTGALSSVAVQRFNASSLATLKGRIAIGATPGAIQFTFASGVSGQLSTIGADNNSYIKYKRIG